ncbi:MAG: hydantoinase B/oxoprolinase family protein [Chloroflexaceae bacterium]|nr:hydantoinase B/oxoprolinase family protein [Chloroflexaceae bacterium]
MMATDPFTIEILREKLLAVADEMSVVLARTSMSPIVYEVLDFACGLTDAEGQVIAQANGLTLFTGTFTLQVQSVINKFGVAGITTGDIFMTNDPYAGGTHTADIALMMPIFAEDRLVGFCITVTHWTELGGKVLGSLPPDSTEVYQEGIQFPIIKLYDAGRLITQVVEMIKVNVRLPDMSLGDLNAATAAVRIGEQRLRETCERYGVALVLEAFEAVLSHGERMVREALQAIPEGVYEAEDFIDGDGLCEDQLPIRVKITVANGEMTADFSGCAPQARGPINCTRPALLSACKTVFRAITNPQFPTNDGCFRPFRVIIPDATVFSCVRPAPCGWYYEASAYATELVWKALAPLLPDKLTAGSYVSLCATYIGGTRSDTGGFWVHPEPHNGGWGAGVDKDGEDGLIATTDGDTYNHPVELIEQKYPLRVDCYRFNTESGGGAGRYRGGLGLVHEYRLTDDGGFLQASLGRSIELPWGIHGGQSGSPNYLEIVRNGEVIKRTARVAYFPLQRDDVVRIVTGRGGGWGPPSERPREHVHADLADGYITVHEAREVYGIDDTHSN